MIRPAGADHPLQPNADGVEAVPSWFWWLPVLVVLCWWPIGSYWASDDFFAVHYAQDLGRAASDLIGPQYAAADQFLFYRPLVTLSLWLETSIGGGNPFVSHLSNAAVLAGCALLMALLLRRLVDDTTAFLAGLVFAVLASHTGAVCWAVGRTDLQSALWMLLSVLLFIRWQEGTQRTRLPSLLAMLLGLMTKESAMATPGLIALCAMAPAATATGRIGRAVRSMWPHTMLLGAYLVFRLVVLGAFGGYQGAALDPTLLAKGLGTTLLDLCNPLRWSPPTFLDGLLGTSIEPSVWMVAGFAPLAWALVWLLCCARRRAVLLLLGALTLCAMVPYAPFWSGSDFHHNLRYYTLPATALVAVLCAPGPRCALLALLLLLPATVQRRIDQHRADRATASMHQRLLDQHEHGLPGPWFVHGLPHMDPTETALQFHFGVDRLLQPPFGPGDTKVYAHRPMAEVPGALRLLDEDAMPVVPTEGTTMTFTGPGGLVTVPANRPGQPTLPDLGLTVDGDTFLSNDAFGEMNEGRFAITLRTDAKAPELVLRLTWFTPTGYLSTMAPATLTETGSQLVLDKTFFTQARWAAGDDSYVLFGIAQAAVLDLEPVYPLLVEAGTLEGLAFTPTHRARTMPRFSFERTVGRLFR